MSTCLLLSLGQYSCWLNIRPSGEFCQVLSIDVIYKKSLKIPKGQ